MGKYDDLRRAEQLLEDKKKYDEWLKLSTAEKSAAYAATQAETGNLKTALSTVEGSIRPFGIELSKNVYLAVNLPDDGTPIPTKTESAATLIASFRTLVGARAVAGKVTGANNIIVDSRGIRGFVPARAIISQKGSKQIKKISRITGRPYSYTQKNSVSCPFGQVTNETSFETAANAIKGGTLPANSKIRFTPQKGILVTVLAA